MRFPARCPALPLLTMLCPGLRIVEDRAVLYLFCPDAESASTCRDLINRQSLQTGLNYRFMDGQT